MAENMAEAVDQIAKLAREGVEPQEIKVGKDVRLVSLPGANSGQGRIIDLEQYLDKPLSKRGTVAFLTPESFAAYFKAHRTADSRIYVDNQLSNPAIVAVFDHFGKDAGWGNHRASYQFRKTPEWEIWLGKDGKAMEQGEFAEFLEDNIKDIVSPVGADMIEIASKLVATKGGHLASSVDIRSGAIHFDVKQEIVAKVGYSGIDVPEKFVLGIEPFVGAGPYKVDARFRFRANNGVTLFYKLSRVSDIAKHAINGIVEAIKSGVGDDAAFYSGVPQGPVSAK